MKLFFATRWYYFLMNHKNNYLFTLFTQVLHNLKTYTETFFISYFISSMYRKIENTFFNNSLNLSTFMIHKQ